ncbi:MAG: LytTR family transcriptional regulator DNA-binding domain-containing protein [Thermoanaerobaculia bacterium]
MTTAPDRVLLNLADGLRRVVDPAEVYYLEAEGGETLVRLRSAKRHVDLREFREIVPLFEPHGFLRISRETAVNLRRIRDIRLRPSGRDWEVKLEPPVNKVLPVSRAALSKLWKAFG